MNTGAGDGNIVPFRVRQFDRDDRERIRGRLLHYLDTHEIGVPTLQKEIARATARYLDHVPLKTLQRFLAGAHRTNDAFVAICEQFVRGLPDHDPVAAFGAGVAGYFLGGLEPEGADLAATESQEHYEGTYAVITASEREDPQSRQVTPPVHYSDLELIFNQEAGYFRARETVYNRPRAKGVTPELSTVRYAYEGVGLALHGHVLVVLKEELTGTDKTYWFREADDPYRIRYRHFIGNGVDSHIDEVEGTPAGTLHFSINPHRFWDADGAVREKT